MMSFRRTSKLINVPGNKHQTINHSSMIADDIDDK